ncbi:AsnC family protein [Thermoanaerobacterium thermosaccharolyticum]|uniref:AsnC family protein n=1 Tax=Thermoanaerobacterium thermosaccharolyticum TaxID=1517 RepID=UPI00215184E7|nr:AsnC family protein [Thermoanaerobacterium thermosaccharolyticum]
MSLLNNLIDKSLRYKCLLLEGYFFILCDKNGYIIKLICDDKFNNYFNTLHFVEGSSLRLEDCGTNAISMAMKYKNQIELCGKDHYCKLFKDWYCTAIPIIDYCYGEVVAYLDVSRINVPSIKDQSAILKNIAIYIEEYLSYKSKNLSIVGSKLDDIDKLILSSLVRNGVRKLVTSEIGISDRTLRKHLNKLSNLFNVDNDLEIVRAAIKIGIIDIDGNIL